MGSEVPIEDFMMGGREVLLESLDSIRVIDLGTRNGLLAVLGVGEGSLCARWRPVACAKALMCEGERWVAAPVFVATAITCMVGCTLAVASELVLFEPVAWGLEPFTLIARFKGCQEPHVWV